MRTIYVSPDFPLNRRMRKDIRRGKLQVVREGGERLTMGGEIPSGIGRAFRTFSSPLVCMADNGADAGVGGNSAETHSWTTLENPGNEHPDVAILREVDKTLTEAKKLRAMPNLNPYFVRQLQRLEGDLLKGADLLRDVRHSVAFIGDVGVGKTSMICGLTNLLVQNKKGTEQSALITGPGGTTVCEVEINQGQSDSKYALKIEPLGNEDIKTHVAEWCEYMTYVATPENGDNEDEKPRVPGEIDRAIRNMSGLPAERVTKPDGSKERVDPAKNLAAQVNNKDELQSIILEKMSLSQRTQTEARGADKDWLRKNFADINDGKKRDFSIPARMEVSIPTHPLGEEEKRAGLNISIVDTKGVDENAVRADLGRCFDDPRAIVVLCSGFTNAPSPSAQLLLERARDNGVRDISEKASILVLPHGNEAVDKQRDEEEMSEEEACEEKRPNVETAIYALGVGKIPIQFFNVQHGNAEKIRAFFIERVHNLRGLHRERLRELNEAVCSLIENRQKNAYWLQRQGAAKRLTDWMSGQDIDAADDKVHSELLEEMRAVRWASSLRASVARRGHWYNFDYYTILGVGARKIAYARMKKWLNNFSANIDGVLADEDLSEAHGFIRETAVWLDQECADLLKRIEAESGEAFKSPLSGDNALYHLWNPAQGEWGRGPGYKHRVTTHNQEWFRREIAAEIAGDIEGKFLSGWRDIMKELRERLSVDSQPLENGD